MGTTREQAKLFQAEVAEAARKNPNTSFMALALQYGISECYVSKIVRAAGINRALDRAEARVAAIKTQYQLGHEAGYAQALADVKAGVANV